MSQDGHDMVAMMDGERVGGAGHRGTGAQDAVRETSDGVVAPTVAVEVTEDPVEGWNLRVVLTDFRIAPERVSTDHVESEGHMHLYIDGNKVTRMYGEWHHIGVLEPGEHEVRVELSSNDHSLLAVGGDIVDATTTIIAGQAGAHEMGHGYVDARAAVEPYPSLSVEVVDDPAGGWNLRAVPSNFRLAPENASSAHVDGEGYMHLYVDGNKVARLYEEWYQLPPIEDGTHEIRVDLRSNDHAPLTVEGLVVDAVVILEVSHEESTARTGATAEQASQSEGHPHGDDSGHGMGGGSTLLEVDIAGADQIISVEVADGEPVGGPRRVKVDHGSVVVLMVSADTAEEVHIHGYDISRTVSGGQPAHITFTANIPGIFEVEFEGSGQLLLQLEIS